MEYPVKYYDALNMFRQTASYAYEECVNDQGLVGSELTDGRTKNNWSGVPKERFGDHAYLASDGRVIVYLEHEGERVTYYKLQVLLSANRQASARFETLKLVCERCGIDLSALQMGGVSDGTLNQGLANGTEYTGTQGGLPVRVSVVGLDALVIVGTKNASY